MTQWGLDAIFNPAKRHMDEEKLRLQSTRAEVGDNSGGKRIDLESGKVVIARAVDGEVAGESGTADAVPAEERGAARANEDELTPAQRRARERRRRASR